DVLAVPAHDGLVAGADVLDVDEDLVSPLLGPDLVARVAGVAEDRPNRRLAPRQPVSMWVALPVVSAGRGDALGRQALGDGVATGARQVLVEDPHYDRRGHRVGLEAVEPLPVSRLAGVGVRAHVDEPVPVRRTAPKESALHRRLRTHGRPDSGLEPG